MLICVACRNGHFRRMISPSKQGGKNKIPESAASKVNSEVVKQLAILNEQLAMQNLNRKRTRKIITVALSAVAAFIVIIIIVAMVTISLFRVKPLSDSVSTTSVTLHCTLNDSEYVYGITYDEQYRIIEAGEIPGLPITFKQSNMMMPIL